MYVWSNIFNISQRRYTNTWSFNLINHQKCKCTSGCLPLLLSIESSLIRQETARRKEKTTKKYFNWNPDFNSDLPSKVYSASITRWVLQTEVELLQITSELRPKKEIRKISQFFWQRYNLQFETPGLPRLQRLRDSQDSGTPKTPGRPMEKVKATSRKFHSSPNHFQVQIQA